MQAITPYIVTKYMLHKPTKCSMFWKLMSLMSFMGLHRDVLGPWVFMVISFREGTVWEGGGGLFTGQKIVCWIDLHMSSLYCIDANAIYIYILILHTLICVDLKSKYSVLILWYFLFSNSQVDVKWQSLLMSWLFKIGTWYRSMWNWHMSI